MRSPGALLWTWAERTTGARWCVRSAILPSGLAADGAEHAVAAAITIALRGQSGCDAAGFASELGLAWADLRALEAGTVAFVDLPPVICGRMPAAGLEPLLLVDLDHQLRGK